MKTITFLITLMCGTVHARLGETLSECEARYGKIVKETAQQVWFRTKGYQVRVHLHEGRCEKIEFEKSSDTDLGLKETFTKAELDALKEANGGGKAWEGRLNLIDDEWQTEGGERLMIYKSIHRTVTFVTKAALEREAALLDALKKANAEKAKAEAEKSLKGF